MVLAAGLMGESAGEKCLARAGRTDNREVGSGPDPVALGQLHQRPMADPATGLAGHVFDAGPQPQPRPAQPGGAAAVVPLFLLAVEQHRETVLEGEVMDARQHRLLLQGLRHAGELEPLQLADNRIDGHGSSSVVMSAEDRVRSPPACPSATPR